MSELNISKSMLQKIGGIGCISWQGYAGLLIGIPGLILGVFMVFVGREKLLFFYITIMLFVLVWFLILGIWSLCGSRLADKH